MTRKIMTVSAVTCLVVCVIAVAVFAQQPAPRGAAPAQGAAPRGQGAAAPRGQAAAAPRIVPEDHRPPLFIREDWKHVPANTPEHPVVQESVVTPNVELKLYGQTKQGIGPDTGVWEIQRASPKDDPTFIYTGPCMTPCALALRDKNNYVDLTGLSKIRWRTKQTGFHYLRPIIKLADGTWLVGEHAEGPSTDWLTTEFSFVDQRWHYLNIDKVVTTKTSDWVTNVDLSKVDEVGFTDLMPGNVADNGHGASGASRIDWIEIYGNPVKRTDAPAAATKANN